MHLNPILSKFMDLVNFDQKLHKLEQEIEQMQKVLHANQEKQMLLKKTVEHDQHLVHELKKKVDEAELHMQILEEQTKQAKERMSFASNSREYESLKREFEKIAHQQPACEAVVLSAWNTLEQAQKNSVKHDNERQEEQTQLSVEYAECERAYQELERQLAEVKAESLSKTQGIPEQWITDYNRMRKSVSNPVVPLENQACSACFETLSSVELAALQRKQVAPCHGCFRFLYIPS